MEFVNLVGQKFGRLTVVERSENNKSGRVQWKCICECGNTKEISSNTLRRGKTKSCGCLRIEENISRAKHNSSSTKLYHVWKGMKARCSNPRNKSYRNYGGRGINVCTEWSNNFPIFKEWALSSGYKEGLTIDRINNNEGYCSENCRWVTRKQQNNNRREPPLRERNSKGQFTGKILKYANDR